MSTLAEIYEQFKVAREKYSTQTKAFIRLRNTLPPAELRSVEEEMQWQQLRREYALASKEFKHAQRVFTSLCAKHTESGTSILSSGVLESGLSLKTAMKEAEHEQNLEKIYSDPALKAIAEAALKGPEIVLGKQTETTKDPDMEVPFEN